MARVVQSHIYGAGLWAAGLLGPTLPNFCVLRRFLNTGALKSRVLHGFVKARLPNGRVLRGIVDARPLEHHVLRWFANARALK